MVARNAELSRLADDVAASLGPHEAAARVVAFVLAQLSLTRAGPGHAGISMHRPGLVPRRLAASSRDVLVLDEVAHRQGSGFALGPLPDGISAVIPDTRLDQQHPAWSRVAARRGIRSAWAVGLPPLDHATLTLTLFSGEPDALTAIESALLTGARAAGHLLAAHQHRLFARAQV
ncbi:hypothetical protein [Nocardioides abyssi]|uniref:GAF domain-containing protein n=1 Tax=Nocardioides abyssi TaxID=3058370 RepID=A0ABT8EUN8_9ACTN|nr:hypothetical protein [Nocardioides abyssi]MDN4161748.1 hypothetical protein [Nocardioides abyssi]